MGYLYHVFKIVKGRKGVSLHAEMSVKASGTPETAAAEILTQLLALASPLNPHRVCRVAGNLRVQPKCPLIPSHTHWWQIQAKSTSLPHVQELLSQAAAATAPLKQSNIVLSKSLFRERHLMNPPCPLYAPHTAGQGTRWCWAGRPATDKDPSQPRWAGADFISNDTQTHLEFLTTPAPLCSPIVWSRNQHKVSVEKQHLKWEALGLKTSNTAELRCLHALHGWKHP